MTPASAAQIPAAMPGVWTSASTRAHGEAGEAAGARAGDPAIVTFGTGGKARCEAMLTTPTGDLVQTRLSKRSARR